MIVADPSVIFREEHDGWAILFNPNNGRGFGINPVGVFIWKQLDGLNTLSDIVDRLENECENVPQDAEKFVKEYIDSLLNEGLVIWKTTR